ncbi:MAG: hypothetical protein V4625_12410 [Pseudomonadota bacterium]
MARLISKLPAHCGLVSTRAKHDSNALYNPGLPATRLSASDVTVSRCFHEVLTLFTAQTQSPCLEKAFADPKWSASRFTTFFQACLTINILNKINRLQALPALKKWKLHKPPTSLTR